MLNNNETITSKPFKYKTNIMKSTSSNVRKLNAAGVALSKYFSGFWRTLDLPLINSETELDLT